MVWNMVDAISTAIIALLTAAMGLVILTTAIFALLQFKEILKSRKFTVFMNLSEFLQREDIREARGTLMENIVKKENFRDWTKEDIEKAEKVCTSYNFAGEMVPKFIDKDMVVPGRWDSIIKCYEAAQPMIKEYKSQRQKDFWTDFDRLYKMAKEYEIMSNTH